MRDDSLSGVAGLPAALSAFLRGIERRAYLFLWLQSGDAAAAEHALVAAIRAFPGPAARMPMAEWPGRFWKLLAALPVQANGGVWPTGVEALSRMPLAVRRALLLRQVAGLEEDAAAAVLEVESAGYEALLAQACPRGPDGAPDAAGWRIQAEAIQQVGRGLEAPQLLRLAQLREAALAARPGAFAPALGDPGGSTGKRPIPGHRADRRRKGLLAVLALLMIMGLAAAAWWLLAGADPQPRQVSVAVPEAEDFRVHDNDPVVIEALADPGPAVTAIAWPPALVDEAPVDPVVAELALLSWSAAGMPDPVIEQEGASTALTAAASEDGAADPDDWARLDAPEQAAVRAAAVSLAAESPQVQSQLRARFAALDTMERRGWRLGPVLGADYASLQPLFGFVEEAERLPLLDALRALAPEQRMQLRALALRTPPANRAALRRELLAQPPEQRDTWLAEMARR